MVKNILKKLVTEQIVLEEEIEIYEYGLECLLLKIIHYSSYFIIAVCMGRIWELCAFLFLFGILRKNAGGFHAKTRTACYIFSCVVVGLFLILSKVQLPILVTASLMMITDIVVWRCAPVSSGNMELDVEEQVHYRKKSRKILAVWNVCYFLCVFSGMEYGAKIIAESCFVEACVLMLEVVDKFIKDNMV